MRNVLRASVLLSISAATLCASGYRIPEQSLNSVALSNAYVANANSADASYYNPANMSFMGTGAEVEAGMTYINLPKVSFAGTDATHSDKSLEEHFFVPTMFYVSPMMGSWRYGLSVVAPGGLSKRWDNFGKRSSEEFTLATIEVNPTASYKFNDQFSVALGARGVYSDGVVKSNASNVAVRDLTGDSIDFGYNLALSYKPIKDLTLSATYRSKIDLTVEGEATLIHPAIAGGYNGGASVTIPLPAVLNIALAYTMDKTTVEFVFDRTYWSAYKELDFNYDRALAAFDAPVPKNWKDVNAYRIGVTHQYNDKLTLMAGFAIDETPAPDNTVGFELPDSDAKLYSVGFDYKINKQLSMGFAYLYDDKEDRTVNNNTGGASTAPSGTFSDSAAHLVRLSAKYKF
ncbi:MAG: OmpP1/FadL family transporter [Sulfurospirillaceae bacterium]|nr:OmpP1/FadL family transporter [Sulfurospirillaceae bacterium]